MHMHMHSMCTCTHVHVHVGPKEHQGKIITPLKTSKVESVLGTLLVLALEATMKASCVDDTGRCGTPGCKLPDQHTTAPCTGQFVDGPRRREGTGFFQAPDFRRRATGAARDAVVAPAVASDAADEDGDGDGLCNNRMVWTPAVGALIDGLAWASTLFRVDQKSWCAMTPRPAVFIFPCAREPEPSPRTAQPQTVLPRVQQVSWCHRCL